MTFTEHDRPEVRYWMTARPSLTRMQRLARMLRFASRPSAQMKRHLTEGYRRDLSARAGISTIPINAAVEWNRVAVTLTHPTASEGHVSQLELLILVALAQARLSAGQHFLEIGTFDGTTARNVAANLPAGSEVITIDLPLDAPATSALPYDNYLVQHPSRRIPCHFPANIRSIRQDSRTLDFSALTFHAAFIDGGHDYVTVESDSRKVLAAIQRPGIVLWHDYDVECPVGDVLHALATTYPIRWIEGTRLAMAIIS